MVRVGAIDAPPKTPFILGLECAGEIVQIGENVEGFQVGFSFLLNFKLNWLLFTGFAFLPFRLIPQTSLFFFIKCFV